MSKSKELDRSPLIRRALEFSTSRHRGQLRKGDGQPYIVHPVAVARRLTRAGMSEEVVAAGLLHDILEDTDATAAEIRRRFGGEVARLVQDVTERDKRLPWEVRKLAYLKHLRHAPQGALAISCADKIHNTQSLLAAYRREGAVVFTRFSRKIQQKLANDRQVYETIRRLWPACPLLKELGSELKKLGVIARRHPALSPDTEVETKFRVRHEKILQRVSRLKELGGLTVIRRSRERQRNTYFDTEPRALKRSRAALKLREIWPVERKAPLKPRRAEVTFKREMSFHRGVSKRREITVLIKPHQIPLLSQGKLSIEPVAQARAIAGGAPLKRTLVLVTDRRRLILAGAKEQVELDLDKVTVKKGNRVAGVFFEVEVENLSASPEVYFRVIEALKSQFGKALVPSRIFKAEYGRRLLGRHERADPS